MAAEPLVRRIDGPAGLATVDRVLDELEDLWSSASHVPTEDRTLFTLAVSEVTTNIVQHSAEDSPVKLSVEIRSTPDDLTAVIRDSAPPAGIDWHAIAMPDEDSESGRGLALAQAALDDFSHRFDDDGNTWTLRRRLFVQR